MFRDEPFGQFARPDIPLRNIAKKLGVDKETIRNRIKRFKETGFLSSPMLLPNPNLFDINEIRLRFDVPSYLSKDDLMRKIRLIPGVDLIINHYGNSMFVGFFSETEQSVKKTIELISRISNTENLFRIDYVSPECKIKLSKTDWSIMKSLQKDPGKTYAVVSRELGISSRTVKRRLERLVDAKALTLTWSYDLKAVDGTVVSLTVFYANPEQRAEINQRILSHFNDCLLRTDFNNKSYGVFNLIILNIAKTHEITAWMKEQPGVSNFRADVIQDLIYLWEPFQEMFDRKLAQIRVLA